MRVEIPECTRCCVCLPLRHGILILGYFNLMISMLVLVLESMYAASWPLTSPTLSVYRGMGVYVDVWCVLLLHTLDVAFTVTLLVGAHMRWPSLMSAYYYYGISTTLATAMTYVMAQPARRRGDFTFYLLEASIIFCGLILEVYLLLMLRSELRKLRRRRSDGFVNPMGGCMDPPDWPHMSDRPIPTVA